MKKSDLWAWRITLALACWVPLLIVSFLAMEHDSRGIPYPESMNPNISNITNSEMMGKYEINRRYQSDKTFLEMLETLLWIGTPIVSICCLCFASAQSGSELDKPKSESIESIMQRYHPNHREF